MKRFFAICFSYLITLPYRIIYGKRLSIGRNFICCLRFRIRGPGKIIIGDNVNSWSFAPQHGTELFTQNSSAVITIGDNTRLNGPSIFARKQVSIGSRCLLSTAIIQDNDFHSKGFWTHHTDINREIATKPVIIGNQVFIGGEAVILKGVTIGNEAIVGLRSVVRTDIPPKATAFGNPATVIA